MKKRRIIAIALAAVLLVFPACDKNHGNTGDDTTDAQVTTTEEGGGSSALDEFISQCEAYFAVEKPDPAKAGALMEAFNALSFEDQCAVPYDTFDKLAEAAYLAVHSGTLEGIDAHRQDVVAEVAKAYYDQSFGTRESPAAMPQILYDQYNSRRNYNAAPEDATAQKNMYLDCSAYISAVYFYTFGINLIPGKSVSTENLNKEYSSKTPDKEGTLLFYITGDELAGLKADSDKAAAQISEIKAILQPGDIINYRRSTGTGHVVMYLGDQKIIHSTGTANPKASTGEVDPITSIEKNAVDEKVFGTVNIDDWDRFFTKNVTPKSQNDGRKSTSNSYLFADNVSAIAIIRPMNEKNGVYAKTKLTAAATDHYLYPGIDIEKTAKVSHAGKTEDLYYGNSCFAGDEITYTVTLRNNSDREMKSLTFRETLPVGLEYVSSGDGSAWFAKDRIVAMYLPSIAAGVKMEFTYTLKVQSDFNGGKSINDSATFVNNIKTNALINQVCAAGVGVQKLTEALNAVKGQKFADGIAAAKAVYAQLPGNGYSCIADQKSDKGMIDTYLAENTLHSGAKYGSAVVRTLYGGYKVGSAEVTAAHKTLSYGSSNIRIRRVMAANLEDGDIIVTYSSFLKEYRAVIFCGSAIYGITPDGTFGSLDLTALSAGASGSLQDYLDTLTAYNAFLVFRPALLG